VGQLGFFAAVIIQIDAVYRKAELLQRFNHMAYLYGTGTRRVIILGIRDKYYPRAGRLFTKQLNKRFAVWYAV
jgi:hypothetical protein